MEKPIVKIVEVEKIVKVPEVTIKEVTKTIEIPIVTEKIKEVEKIVEKVVY